MGVVKKTPRSSASKSSLHSQVGDAKHEDVVEPLARLGVERVGSAAALAAEQLAVGEVRRPAVLGDGLGRVRERQRELVEVGHGRHGETLPRERGPRSLRAPRVPGRVPTYSVGGT
jgi:hypothetical protein